MFYKLLEWVWTDAVAFAGTGAFLGVIMICGFLAAGFSTSYSDEDIPEKYR